MKARGVLLSAALCAAGAGLSGCVATQQDVLGVAQQNDDLKTQITELRKTISSMQANQADLSVQIKQLHEDLTAYSETIKASQGDMGQLSAKLDGLGQQISGKVTQLGATLSAAQQVQQKGLEQQGRETAATQLFVTAQNRLQAKDYEQAAAGFEEYLKRFPSGSLSDVTLYNLGMAYYNLKQWDKAGRQFAVVLDKYPKSGQTPGARLRYAQCLIRLKKGREEARAYLESVRTDFPKTPEADEAADVLKRLRPSKSAKKPASQ